MYIYGYILKYVVKICPSFHNKIMFAGDWSAHSWVHTCLVPLPVQLTPVS